MIWETCSIEYLGTLAALITTSPFRSHLTTFVVSPWDLCSQVSLCLLPDRWMESRDDGSNADQSMCMRYHALVRGEQKKSAGLHRPAIESWQPRRAHCRTTDTGAHSECNTHADLPFTSNLHTASPMPSSAQTWRPLIFGRMLLLPRLKSLHKPYWNSTMPTVQSPVSCRGSRHGKFRGNLGLTFM